MSRETKEALRALKRDTGIDYTHADPQTQEEQADLYLAVVAAMSARTREEKTPEQVAADHAQHHADTFNRYRRNGWNMPKEYAGIPWERIATIQGAADMLGVTRGRVHQLIRAGKLDGQQVDHIWLVDRASVEKRLEQNYSSL